MATTPNYSFSVYSSTDTDVRFLDFRVATAGSQSTSNFYVIDTVLKQHSDAIDSINATPSAFVVKGTYSAGSLYTASVANYPGYKNEQLIVLSLNQKNTGAVQININGTTNKDVMKYGSDGVLKAVDAGDFVANSPVLCLYDGTQFVVIGITSASSITVTGEAGDILQIADDGTIESSGKKAAQPNGIATLDENGNVVQVANMANSAAAVYSGEPVTVEYAGAQRIASITAYGETPQGGTTEAPVALTGVDEVLVAGNNLCPKGILKTITREGVTFTHNPDGSVSVQGTASKNADYYYFGQYNMPNSNSVKLGTGKYTLSGCPSNIILYLIDIEKIIASQLNSTPVVFTKPLMEITCVLIRVPEGKTVNETVYPMLNIGATALPYEPYNGSITPLPIPRPLRRVGDVRDVCVTRQEHEGAEKLVVTYNVGFVELDVTENVMFQDYGNFKRLFLDLNSSALSRYSLEFSHGEVGAIPTIAGGLAASFNEANLYRLQILGAPDTWTTLGVTDTTTAKTWLAAQKAAGTPVQIAYQLATPEVYATDPVDFDNTAGPLTVVTGGQVEVKMTDFVTDRTPAFLNKLDKTGDGSDVTVTFTEAATDTDIASGDKLSILFGKILKRFSTITSKFTTVDNSITQIESDISDITDGTTVVAQANKVTNALVIMSNSGTALVNYDGSATANMTLSPSNVGAEPAFTKNTAFNKNFGSSAGTVCQGNDGRLSDARRSSNISMSLSGTNLSISYS